MARKKTQADRRVQKKERANAKADDAAPHPVAEDIVCDSGLCKELLPEAAGEEDTFAPTEPASTLPPPPSTPPPPPPVDSVADTVIPPPPSSVAPPPLPGFLPAAENFAGEPACPSEGGDDLKIALEAMPMPEAVPMPQSFCFMTASKKPASIIEGEVERAARIRARTRLFDEEFPAPKSEPSAGVSEQPSSPRNRLIKALGIEQPGGARNRRPITAPIVWKFGATRGQHVLRGERLQDDDGSGPQVPEQSDTQNPGTTCAHPQRSKVAVAKADADVHREQSEAQDPGATRAGPSQSHTSEAKADADGVREQSEARDQSAIRAQRLPQGKRLPDDASSGAQGAEPAQGNLAETKAGIDVFEKQSEAQDSGATGAFHVPLGAQHQDGSSSSAPGARPAQSKVDEPVPFRKEDVGISKGKIAEAKASTDTVQLRSDAQDPGSTPAHHTEPLHNDGSSGAPGVEPPQHKIFEVKKDIDAVQVQSDAQGFGVTRAHPFQSNTAEASADADALQEQSEAQDPGATRDLYIPPCRRLQDDCSGNVRGARPPQGKIDEARTDGKQNRGEPRAAYIPPCRRFARRHGQSEVAQGKASSDVAQLQLGARDAGASRARYVSLGRRLQEEISSGPRGARLAEESATEATTDSAQQETDATRAHLCAPGSRFRIDGCRLSPGSWLPPPSDFPDDISEIYVAGSQSDTQDRVYWDLQQQSLLEQTAAMLQNSAMTHITTSQPIAAGYAEEAARGRVRHEDASGYVDGAPRGHLRREDAPGYVDNAACGHALLAEAIDYLDGAARGHMRHQEASGYVHRAARGQMRHGVDSGSVDGSARARRAIVEALEYLDATARGQMPLGEFAGYADGAPRERFAEAARDVDGAAQARLRANPQFMPRFCMNCGTARVKTQQKFCISCGASTFA